jgi:hypothetical protein
VCSGEFLLPSRAAGGERRERRKKWSIRMQYAENHNSKPHFGSSTITALGNIKPTTTLHYVYLVRYRCIRNHDAKVASFTVNFMWQARELGFHT